ncbi:MAG TPA: energy transducer TonB [Thermoanaerobaculia bacterium]|nr:energy transducer TonB [Thermoanaerobaculia bacterium]
MDLKKTLIESGKRQGKRPWKNYIFSAVVHSLLVGLIIFVSLTAHKVTAESKPIRAFLETGGAPPPPPPPPPPPASSSSSAPKVTPKQVVKPIETPTFVQPRVIPKTLPSIVVPEERASTPSEDTGISALPTSPGTSEGGVVGGVTGGVQGGTVGGEIGGVIGGVKGGVVGGTLGGTGITLGGTGTGQGGNGDSGGPLRVGGDVKAPTVTQRIQPEYTSAAKSARVAGIVIVEAIIDRNGNVNKVSVIKGLPMGLTESAINAVKGWKFRPGTLNGRPVDVIFNLTVVFTLGHDEKPQITNPREKKHAEPIASPAPAPAVEPAAPETSTQPAEPAPLPTPPPAGGGQ